MAFGIGTLMKGVSGMMRSLRDNVREVGQEALGEAIGRQVPEFIKDRVQKITAVPDRGELYADLAAMPRDEIENLMRRIDAAVRAKCDDRLVTQLLKIPREQRPEVFELMDRMSNEEFDAAIAFLEQEMIPQDVKRFVSTMVAAVGKAGMQLGDEVKKIDGMAARLALKMRASDYRQGLRKQLRLKPDVVVLTEKDVEED